MNYLTGEQIEIKASVLKKLIGVKVEILRKADVTSRGIMQNRLKGAIEEVLGRNISINGDWVHFSEIKEIVKY